MPNANWWWRKGLPPGVVTVVTLASVASTAKASVPLGLVGTGLLAGVPHYRHARHVFS
eukprot:SAG11_NODE_31546_length_291_cov_0.692708_1_plen_57_part_10